MIADLIALIHVIGHFNAEIEEYLWRKWMVKMLLCGWSVHIKHITYQHWAWSPDQIEPIERGRVKRRSSKLNQREVCVLTNEPPSTLKHTAHTHICRLRQNEPINTSYSACVYRCLWPLGLLTILNKQIRTCERGSTRWKGRAYRCLG